MDKDRLIDETLEQLDACERGPEGGEWRDRDAAAKVLEAFAATLLAPYGEAMQLALGALADIANSADMAELGLARKKARRIYAEVQPVFDEAQPVSNTPPEDQPGDASSSKSFSSQNLPPTGEGA